MQLRGCEFIRISAIEIAAPKVLKLEVPLKIFHKWEGKNVAYGTFCKRE
jgi:hypothetical protein